MKQSWMILLCAATLATLNACSPSEGGKTNRVALSDAQKKAMGGFSLSCNKPEDTQDFSQIAKDKVISFSEVTEAQQTELVNCQGEIKDIGVTDVKSFQDSFFLGPEQKVENVRFVTVKNTRTCSEFKVEISKDEAEAEKVSVRESVLYPSHELLLVFTTGKVRGKNTINVTDGKNLLEITYHGDCKDKDSEGEINLNSLRNKDGKFDEAALKRVRANLAAKKCSGSQVLSTQQLVIDVALQRTTVPGIRQIDSCLRN